MAKSKYIIEFEKKLPEKNEDGKLEFAVDDIIRTLGVFITRDGRKIVADHMVLEADMRVEVDKSIEKEGLFPEEQYKQLKEKKNILFDIDMFRKKVGNFVRLLAIENSTILRALIEKDENKMAINLLNSGEIFNMKLLVPAFQSAMKKRYLGIAQSLVAMFIRKNKDEFAILGNKHIIESGISKNLMLGLFRKENFVLFDNLLSLDNFAVDAKVDMNDHKDEVQEFIEHLVEEKKEAELKNLCALLHCKIDKKFADKIKDSILSKDLVDMLHSKPSMDKEDKPKEKIDKKKAKSKPSKSKINKNKNK